MSFRKKILRYLMYENFVTEQSSRFVVINFLKIDNDDSDSNVTRIPTLTSAPRRNIWNSDDSGTCSDAPPRVPFPDRCIHPRDRRSFRILRKDLCYATRISCRERCKEKMNVSVEFRSTICDHSSCELEKYINLLCVLLSCSSVLRVRVCH